MNGISIDLSEFVRGLKTKRKKRPEEMPSLKTKRKKLQEMPIEPNAAEKMSGSDQGDVQLNPSANKIQENKNMMEHLDDNMDLRLENENVEGNEKVIFELLTNNKGGTSLWINKDQKFRTHSKCNEKIYWKCVHSRCKTTAITYNNEPDKVTINGVHSNCIPFPEGYQAEKQRCEIREKAVSMPTQIPSKIVMESKKKLTIAALFAAASDDADIQLIGRKRRKVDKNVNMPNFMDIEITYEYSLTNERKRFLIYDSKRDHQKEYTQNHQRIIIFASKESLNILRKNRNWSCDGTFAIRPHSFQAGQLFIVGCRIKQHVIPCVYAVLSGKAQNLYKEVFEQIYKRIKVEPLTVLSDFERGILNAGKIVFQSASIQCCFFHLCQNLWRKWINFGLSTLYSENENARLGFRTLMSLAFLPEDVIRRAFYLIVQLTENNDDKLKNFFHYFARTYLGLAEGEDNPEAFTPMGRNLMDNSIMGSTIMDNTIVNSTITNFSSNQKTIATINTSQIALPSFPTSEQSSQRLNDSRLEQEEPESDIMQESGTLADHSQVNTTISNNPLIELVPLPLPTIRKNALFDYSLWNVRTRVEQEMARTNNGMEGVHSRMQAECSTMPVFTNFITFLRGFDEDRQQFYRTIDLKGPKKRKRKYEFTDRRILQIMREQNNFETEKQIYHFLKKISNCMAKFTDRLQVDPNKSLNDTED